MARPRLVQLLAAAGLLCHCVTAGPLPAPAGLVQGASDAPQIVLQAPPSAQGPRRLHGRFLHITDLHPDEFYKVHSSTEEEAACHHGKGPAGTYGAETSDCDSPHSLINATFDWIAKHVADDIDFVIWTGDSARHDSDERIPRSPAQVLGSNRRIADLFSETFADRRGGANGLAIPVIPTLGNNDILPHNILLPGPNKWLQKYTDIWSDFIPEEQRHGFEFGGWFYVEVIPNQLAVFSLNTLYFFDRNAGVDDCAQPSEPGFKQMEWLRIQLQFMRQRGMKAILMGHVPPARTESKQLWDETCWQKYTLWLDKYRDVVVSGIYGHMNIDHFLLQDTKDIDITLIEAGDPDENLFIRDAMEDELSIESTASYLQELRDDWAKIPRPFSAKASEVEELVKKGKKHHKGKKHKKGKKRLGRWAERFQLTLVSPSIVPNYYPTLRIIEYNITGLESAATWADTVKPLPVVDDLAEDTSSELRDVPDLEADSQKKHGKGKKNAKGDKKKKKPKDPNLVIPDPPSKSSRPGPAYSAQPLTLTGYTQYYANITQINNDMTRKTDIEAERWRQGKHHNKEPQQKPPKPRKFKYEVEYSTFKDKLYNVSDLTVKSFVQLAYRMGQGDAKSNSLLDESDLDWKIEALEDDEDEGWYDNSDNDDEDDDEEAEDSANKGGKGGKKKHKNKKHNKIWLHFLRHAFVSTMEEDELKEMFH